MITHIFEVRINSSHLESIHYDIENGGFAKYRLDHNVQGYVSNSLDMSDCFFKTTIHTFWMAACNFKHCKISMIVHYGVMDRVILNKLHHMQEVNPIILLIVDESTKISV